ncbi:hypothetical protein [Salipiger mucosus]|uniref:Uncharacterized protein n=1 Tax=Salipiger mucosus DSM 16094 TaxID=1123237 RepID=S9QRG5_9RHOB|nr:hypothetical protein [Salipiger mucosus]EPX83986.1 hypothetical protein Salmuc_01761 [Salipiger mucosus DSM 16094]
MKLLRKCLRAVGLVADGFEITFAAATAFLSANVAIYCAHLTSQGWAALSFPLDHWARYDVVLPWFQSTIMTGQGLLLLKTWGTAGLCGFFSVVTLTAAQDAFSRFRARCG